MSEQKMYRFHVNFGRHGDIDGVFCATPEEVAAAVGVHVWFEEPWGKHSSADCAIEAGHFSILTDDQDFIAKAKRYGISRHGESPLGLIADMRSDGRLPPLPEIQSPITDAAIDAAIAKEPAPCIASREARYAAVMKVSADIDAAAEHEPK